MHVIECPKPQSNSTNGKRSTCCKYNIHVFLLFGSFCRIHHKSNERLYLLNRSHCIIVCIFYVFHIDAINNLSTSIWHISICRSDHNYLMTTPYQFFCNPIRTSRTRMLWQNKILMYVNNLHLCLNNNISLF